MWGNLEGASIALQKQGDFPCNETATYVYLWIRKFRIPAYLRYADNYNIVVLPPTQHSSSLDDLTESIQYTCNYVDVHIFRPATSSSGVMHLMKTQLSIVAMYITSFLHVFQLN